MVSRLRRHTLLSSIVAIFLLIFISVAIANATGVFGPELATPSRTGMTQSVPSAIASAFAIETSAATSADTLPAEAATALTAEGTIGVNSALSRFAGEVHGYRVWLASGSTGTCAWISGAGAICAENERVATRGLELTGVPDSGGASFSVGVIPTEASISAHEANGTEASIVTSGNAFYVQGQGAATQPVVHTASGASVNLAVVSSHSTQP
jgi:hypothetical protein